MSDAPPTKYARRVRILSATGRYVKHVPAEVARKMVERAEATASQSKEVHQITLTAFLSSPDEPPTKSSLRQYQGRRYTYKEDVSSKQIPMRVITLRTISKLEQKILAQAQEDCQLPKSSSKKKKRTRKTRG